MSVYELHIKEKADGKVTERVELFEGYWRDAQILGDKIAKNSPAVTELEVTPKGVKRYNIYHYWK